MKSSKPEITTAEELLAHMHESQAAYIANRSIEKRRVRLVGVEGWFWLVLRLAYPEVGRKAITVPSANSVRERIDQMPAGGIRMVRFATAATNELQAMIKDNSDEIKNKKGKGKNTFKVQFVRSTNGYTISGMDALPPLAFQYPALSMSNHIVYGLAVDGKAVFVLSSFELDKADCTPEQVNGLFDVLAGGIANVQSPSLFDQEPEVEKQKIRDYLRSAVPLPASN